MVTAIASLLTGKSVDPDVGMTGEVTLRGKVLRIGGLKEKVLAAARAGLGTVIMPAANEADLEDLPENVREMMNFIPVETVDEVLDTALQAAPAPPVNSPSAAAPHTQQDQPGGDGDEELLEPLEYVSRTG